MGRGGESHCQHRLKRAPKPSPFRGPTFDGLIGGDAVENSILVSIAGYAQSSRWAFQMGTGFSYSMPAFVIRGKPYGQNYPTMAAR